MVRWDTVDVDSLIIIKMLYARLPEWSKGVHLRCTVFALVGSNPTPSKSAPVAQLVRALCLCRKGRGFKSPREYSAGVAQSVERMTLNHVAAGSSPAGGFPFYFCFSLLDLLL